MTVEQALELFYNFPRIKPKLETMRDVGLGYIRLGQPATTLSGGEAQRVKLSTELSKRATGKTLYLLDEPTTGLSFEDCAALLRVLHRLVDAGNTVVLIEHHLDMIKNADWIIDLGPGAGNKGGELVATGTPEQVMAVEASHTGYYIRQLLGEGVPVEAPSKNGRKRKAATKKETKAVRGEGLTNGALPAHRRVTSQPSGLGIVSDSSTGVSGIGMTPAKSSSLDTATACSYSPLNPPTRRHVASWRLVPSPPSSWLGCSSEIEHGRHFCSALPTGSTGNLNLLLPYGKGASSLEAGIRVAVETGGG